IAALPAETTVNCPTAPEFAVASATDNCGSDFTLTFEDVTAPGACAGSYSVTRTWTATDACGNTSEALQKINVQDITAPVIAALPAETTVNCPTAPEFAVASATDNCGSDFTLTFEDVTAPGACAGSYSVTRTWTATDACGNTSEASQKINVEDVTAPVVSCPVNISVNNDKGVCGATVAVPKPTVNADCSSVTLTNSFNETADASGLYPVGTTTIVWTVKDGCGNTSTCSMTVTVTDTEVPVITCPANIVTCSSSQVVLSKPTATDNCGDLTLNSNAPATFETGTTSVIWTATDIHGNSSTCTQTVTISPMVTANAGDDKSLCAVAPFTFTNAVAANYSALAWTHNGLGILSDATALNPTYTPAAGETGAIEFKLTAYGSSGCGNMVISDLVTLRFYPAITVNAGNDQVIISGTATTLNGTVSGGSGEFTYAWSPAQNLISNNDLHVATVPLNNEFVFTLTALDAASGCSASDEIKISMDNIIRPIAVDDFATTLKNIPLKITILANDTDPIGLGLNVSITDYPKNGTVILNEDGTITYTPAQNYDGYDTLTYTICDKGVPSKCATAEVIILTLTIREDIEIFNLVTPDNDGKNDYWHIGGIEEFPDNEITIFNRWGTKVREIAGYNNSDKRWDGTDNKSEYLPDGVYFYIIKIKELKNYTGWVYVRGNH
ncbi:MAG: gliding motility-associated C-terminal domain-containing protein, partial [Bacteroidales bacterium]|nr:gliding motility-associated C-terminal domain-containing protein [Bacteroidales bacterium]